MEPEVADYLDALTARVTAAIGGRLAGLWAVGSLALGAFDRARSDIDVQAAVDEPLPRAELLALADALDHARLPCPARKLEFVLYESAAAPAFALNLNTGAGIKTHIGLDPDREPRFWFVVDVAIARQSAIVLAGEPAATVLPEQPRERMAGALLEALDWFEAEETPEALAPAAVRAWAWATTGRWLSKRDALATRPEGNVVAAAREALSAAGSLRG